MQHPIFGTVNVFFLLNFLMRLKLKYSYITNTTSQHEYSIWFSRSLFERQNTVKYFYSMQL